MDKTRCGWCTSDPLYITYHDEEWGKPVKDDPTLFEFLVLESFQAGLSWLTILKKRENFRKAFSGFDVKKVAAYGEPEFQRLMNDAGIIRNRQKIEATINNAQRFLEVQQEFGSFSAYIWGFLDQQPVINSRASLKEVPARTELSDRISKDMKKRGFKFFGTTICYAHMQATGMVNDHTTDCFLYHQYSGKN